MTQGSGHIFTIPPGTPFLKTLAVSLCEGRLSEGFQYDRSDPLSLSNVTIFVPTRRSARVLRSEFVDLLGGRSAILPVIRPLGETDDDRGYFDLSIPDEMDLALPIGGVARLLELGRLVLAWRNRLPQVVIDIHADSPLIAPASPADAIWLGRALAELIDSVETEEGDWDDLKKLNTAEHALWWQLTAEFLSIANAFWPARLEELGRSSPARHQALLLRGEAQQILKREFKGPIIVAGSTGSVPAAADLICAIASLPQGAIVLPGLDTSMPRDQWEKIHLEAKPDRHESSCHSHPQFGMSRLLHKLGIDRGEVSILDEPTLDLQARAATLSQAMAPASTTDGWSQWRASSTPDALHSAFSDVALIEASNEREEAVSIAIALRLALERPGRDGSLSTAALITPDRTLARRVVAELARFDILADDTAGTPLSATPQGTLIQILLEATLQSGAGPVALTSLLKHELVQLGLDPNEMRGAAEALELLALRGGLGNVDISTLDALLEAKLVTHAEDKHPPSWRKTLSPDTVAQTRDLVVRLQRAVEPLTSALREPRSDGRRLTSLLPLSDWAERTGRALEALCSDRAGDLSALWSGEAGERLSSLLTDVIEAEGQMVADGLQWADAVQALAIGEAVKPRSLSDPRVFIFGTLEARLQYVDTMILGGLNEGSWPGQTVNNPFLSRTMKTDIGLEPPERRIGQLAHDFQMASGTRHLIYSRSLRQGSAPTVASRWLQRLLALGGDGLAGKLRDRGEKFRQWANLIDIGEAQAPAKRPSPTPPVHLQPVKYSFSEVGRLRRDPYSVYARRILKLDPVDPFNSDPGAAQRGTLYHAIIDRYTREQQLPDRNASQEAMRLIIDELFDAEHLPLYIDRIWRPRFKEVASAFLMWEKSRAHDIRKTVTECSACWDIPGAGIRLTGIADRIDIKGSGAALIIDYKTGSSPTPSQARSLLDPQLALEAAALQAGAFKSLGAVDVDELIYVRLKPGDRFKSEVVNNEAAKNGKSASDLAEESVVQLTKFVTLLRTGEVGFASRLVPYMQRDYGGDYDHLARVAEWSTADNDGEDSDE